MKRFIALAALSLALTACATAGKAPSLKEAHIAKQKALHAQAVAQLYSPACPAPAYYDQTKCGLENDTFTADLQKFTLESCQGLKGDDCEAKFSEKVIPRWQARYPRANVAEIAEWCGSHAKDCHNLSLQELRWMDSHNQTVLAELDRNLNGLKQETRLAYEEKVKRLSTGSTLQIQAASQSSAMQAPQAAMMAPPPPGR